MRDNVLRLTLLRSPTYPAPDADQGQHRFVYSLYPHSGAWDWHTVAQAYMLNDPHIVWTRPSQGVKRSVRGKGLSLQISQPLLSVDTTNVIIETIKWAEDDEGVIARLYEYRRTRGPVRVTAGFPVRDAWRANLLEENVARLPATARDISLTVRPYEIVTLRVRP